MMHALRRALSLTLFSLVLGEKGSFRTSSTSTYLYIFVILPHPHPLTKKKIFILSPITTSIQQHQRHYIYQASQYRRIGSTYLYIFCYTPLPTPSNENLKSSSFC